MNERVNKAPDLPDYCAGTVPAGVSTGLRLECAMSLETWKAEFYPVEADKATGSDMDALDHSIVKWTGLLKESLEKHGGGKDEHYLKIIEFGNSRFVVDGRSCALCEANFYAEGGCHTCPIYRSSGRDCEKEFACFRYKGDARPMLTLLKRTKKWLENQQ